MSVRAIGRLLGVLHRSVAKWVAAAARQLPARVGDATPADTIEGDELYTFVGAKKGAFVAIAVARTSRLIVGQWVTPAFAASGMQAMADGLPEAGRYCTDGSAVSPAAGALWEAWPEGARHVVSIGKEETDTIEGVNAGGPPGSIRTYSGRLKRRSRCFSRSMERLREAVRLFVRHDNRRQRVMNANSRYRGTLPLLF